mmetsp:Transcript_1959/g.5131  ORF Transcript_1959/g.5131 Transcript_1959/m.5131 type:complete len:303 (-) Transcript_1959:1298-2206(-)
MLPCELQAAPGERGATASLGTVGERAARSSGRNLLLLHDGGAEGVPAPGEGDLLALRQLGDGSVRGYPHGHLAQGPPSGGGGRGARGAAGRARCRGGGRRRRAAPGARGAVPELLAAPGHAVLGVVLGVHRARHARLLAGRPVVVLLIALEARIRAALGLPAVHLLLLGAAGEVDAGACPRRGRLRGRRRGRRRCVAVAAGGHDARGRPVARGLLRGASAGGAGRSRTSDLLHGEVVEFDGLPARIHVVDGAGALAVRARAVHPEHVVGAPVADDGRQALRDGFGQLTHAVVAHQADGQLAV